MYCIVLYCLVLYRIVFKQNVEGVFEEAGIVVRKSVLEGR